MLQFVLAAALASRHEGSESCPNSVSYSLPSVSTIAGGEAGITDGPAHGARFQMPTGVAIAPDGRILIADGAAERIRLLDKGRVSTLTGDGAPDVTGLYVSGGYLDGPTSSARFNHPAGIAIAPNGDVYVADMDNNAVRKIHDGMVSTFMGGPLKQGPDIGSVANVTATKVFGVAVDAVGEVYVANSRGLRIVDSKGNVTRFRDEVKPVLGVAVYGSGPNRAIYEVTASGIDYYGPNNAERHIYADTSLPEGGQTMMAAADLIGQPTAITALSEYAAAFTDLRDGTVYVINAYGGNIDAVFGSRIQNESGDESLERDGRAVNARFDAPWGIAYDTRSKSLVVADAGGRRIRRIGPIHLRGLGYDDAALANASSNIFRVAFVGNSFAYFHTQFDPSIEGLLERKLSQASHKCVVVTPVNLGSNLNNYTSYLSAYSDLFDLFIVELNSIDIRETFGLKADRLNPYDDQDLIAAAPMWKPRLTETLAGFQKTLGFDGHLLLVVHPTAQDISPNELLWNRVFLGYGNPSLAVEEQFPADFHKAIAASRVAYYDMSSDFGHAEVLRQCALFGTANEHPTLCARQLTATIITRQILLHHLIPLERETSGRKEGRY